MKILTISSSPYLITRNSRINRDVILSLKAKGHHVESLVWHHDTSYFLPTEDGTHFFDHDGERVCLLHPYIGERGGLSQFAYELMKKVQPQIVITIGSYYETVDIFPIKQLYPQLFKWIAIFCNGTTAINENFKERIEYADMLLCTSECGAKTISNTCSKKCEYLPYGPDRNMFFPIPNELPDEFGVMTSAKNAQLSNLGVFIDAVSKCPEIDGYIHTNVDDVGDQDLRLLLRRHKCVDKVGIPEQKFISVREGIKDGFLNQLYNRYHAIVDCSMQSATALSLLEGMSTGCVPIGVNFGAVGEVISMMPKECQLLVPHYVYTGPREEEYAIASSDGLRNVLQNVYKRYRDDRLWFEECRRESKKIACIFTKEKFENRINKLVEDAIPLQSVVTVDSF